MKRKQQNDTYGFCRNAGVGGNTCEREYRKRLKTGDEIEIEENRDRIATNRLDGYCANAGIGGNTCGRTWADAVTDGTQS